MPPPRHSIIVFFMYPYSVVDPEFAFYDIFKWDDRTLESKHDYIQWYFPLTVPSKHHPEAPVLNFDQLSMLRGKCQKRVRHLQAEVFERMMKFYGFKKKLFGGWKTVTNWNEELPAWVNPCGMDHNYLRITRIITSLKLLGNEKLAGQFLDALMKADDRYEDGECFPEEVKMFWSLAYYNTNPEQILRDLKLAQTTQVK